MRILCHGNEEWCKIWRGIDLSVQNWHEEYDEFWPEHSKISKICTLMDCFWPKYIMFELKKYREVMFDGTEYWCKTWRKNDLCFQKSQRNLAYFHQNMFGRLKIGMSLNFTGKFCVMTMKNDPKIEEELTCQFKIDMRNSTNFDPNTRKSQKFAL